MSFEYLSILLFLLLISISFHKTQKIRIFDNLKHMLIFYGVMLLVGIVWDNFAVYRGHWYYPGKGTLGLFIGFIPLEDYFFIIICSYFGLVFYKTAQKLKS
ncbi:hypothetical protein A3F03_03080 [Candidatus Roizmanbacteria bacterium RIFCSPHIGHO2_12_FULL_41_11]|uniref:Lycopene cyclase domain-containing protein n=3 Tax=Candidatus Roizmaniibacteriota TaxID=1752723 RepID=A0A1F7JRG2_9BACT|nr:MAG: hypothetical protein A3F03_03080 [Candidatus Roizmanbacteria bacterium RIFCSPHIGHO2_12_FULL_41_11]OGK51726.1 MAG: hypothetical protein A2966_01220 [Candidatus Roizmanbacteria bacterium RIFCSPLOWO2_01_FULL_41_22]OGK58178.1 MAG: hypothetical protein A3H86_02135 [Candidatus Roizmanbacteria bacterium RIFCSPLOWO2_02_FULL_41_9]